MGPVVFVSPAVHVFILYEKGYCLDINKANVIFYSNNLI